MPDHARKQIRDAVKEKLQEITELTSVETGRVFNVEESKLPSAFIYTTTEESELEEMVSRNYERTCALSIEVYQAGSNIDDDLDALALLVEKKMEESQLLTYRTTFQLDSSELEFNGEGAKIHGVLTMTYTFNYQTLESEPETIL